MKKEWSEQNKSIQLQLKKNDTFAEGIDTLIMLRKGLMHEILQFKDELSQEDFFAMPFSVGIMRRESVHQLLQLEMNW